MKHTFFILLLLILSTHLFAQQATVNPCDCCKPPLYPPYGEQIDCLGGLPFIEMEDTIPMFSLAGSVELSPIYYPLGGTANWSNGQNTLTVSVSPGTYEVTYSTHANCSFTDTITVIAYSNAISGNIFEDTNGDGFRDGGEIPPASPVVVSLYDSDLQLILFDTTDSQGDYFFEGLLPADYVLRIDTPLAGTVITQPGVNNSFEPVSRSTFPITVTPSSVISGIDCGLFPQNPGTVSGRAWFDENGNGIQDPGEPPIVGVPFFIQDIRGGTPDVIETDEFGNYVFPYLPQGNYLVNVFPPEEFPIFAPPNQGQPNNNSDFIPIPTSPPSGQIIIPIPVNPGQQQGNIDAGLRKDTVVRVKVIGILTGADRGNGEMGTELEQGGLLPSNEPYSGLGYGLTEDPNIPLLLTKVTGVVDYVVVELRDKNDSSIVVASRSGYMLKDGSVVDECGNSLTFKVPKGSYYVALRHRNHLDIRTKDPVFLDDQEFKVDFSDPNTQTAGLDPQKQGLDGRLGLWSGDASGDNELKYSGPGNDRSPILNDIGGTDITNSTSGYKLEDVNLDGIIKYSGPDNDRQPILENLGGTDITNTKKGGG